METELREYLNIGIDYMTAGNYEKAAEEFKKILEKDSECTEAYIHLGNAYVNQENYQEGLKAFKTALMFEPENGLVLYSIAGTYLLSDNFAEALKYYNRAETAGYRTIEMYQTMSVIFIESEDYPQAIRAISKAIELKPLRGDLYVRKAELQIEAGMQDEALETLEEFKELIPDAANTYMLGVQIYCLRKEYRKALEIAEEGLARFPEDPAMQLLKCKALVEGEAYEEARDYLLEVRKNELNREQLRTAVMYQATSYARLEQGKEIVQVLEEYLKENEDQEMAYFLLNTYLLLKDYDGIIKTADKLIAMPAEDRVLAAALYYRAHALQQRDGMAAAEAEFKRLTRELRTISVRVPNGREIYIYRLLLHTELKEYEKALNLTEYLKNAYPEMTDGYLYSYFVYKRMGNREKALEARDAALQIDPDLKLEPLDA